MDRLQQELTSECASRIRLAVIQASPFCNLDCHYCYLPGRHITSRISADTLEAIGRILFSSHRCPQTLTIAWHAGEPLAVSHRFYRRAFAILGDVARTRGIALRYAFQTNATLLNNESCDLIKAYDVQVGVSVDGPAFLNDRCRVDRSGRGTFVRVDNGIKLLRKFGVDFHVITVLTRQHLDHPEAIWAFIVERGITRVGFNIEEVEGVHRRTSLQEDGIEARYRRFFETMIELNESAGNPVAFREIDALTRRITKGRTPVRSSPATPFAIVSFDWQGNVSTFSPELLSLHDHQYGGFTFGNVHEIRSLEEIVTHPRFARVWGDVNTGIGCCRKECEYFSLCGGGVPGNKLGEHGTFAATETLHCRLQVKTLTDLLLDRLESRAESHVAD